MQTADGCFGLFEPHHGEGEDSLGTKDDSKVQHTTP